MSRIVLTFEVNRDLRVLYLSERKEIVFTAGSDAMKYFFQIVRDFGLQNRPTEALGKMQDQYAFVPRNGSVFIKKPIKLIL